MEFMDDMKISEMNEGETYPITQQGHEYSSGVLVTKKGDEIHLRHFWKNYGKKDDYYIFEGEFGFPREAKYDDIDVLHKNVLTILPMDLLQEPLVIPQEKMNLAFEDMTLGEFYEHIFLGICYLESKKDYKFHEKIDVYHTRYDRNGIPNKKPRV